MQDNEFIVTSEMVAQMRDAIKQMEEAKNGLSERVEAVAKFYNSKIARNLKITSGGYEFEIERFLGYIGYHKIDWKPLNSASFERLLYEFYKEEISIAKSCYENDMPINEQRILDIERIGKAILHESTPSHQVEENKVKYSAVVIMAVAQIVDKIEPFLPTDDIGFDKKIPLTQKAIFDKLGIEVGNGIRNLFNPFDKLRINNKKKVVELLNAKGYSPQAKEFELKNIVANR